MNMEVPAIEDFSHLFKGDKWYLPTNILLVPQAVAELVTRLENNDWNNPKDLEDIQYVFNEILTNAIAHGNQNIKESELYDENGEFLDIRKVSQRVAEKTHISKKVYVSLKIDKDEIYIVVRDQGNGNFDPNNLPDPRNIENLLKPTGRGIFTTKEIFDHVFFDFPKSGGTQVTLVKYKKPKSTA